MKRWIAGLAVLGLGCGDNGGGGDEAAGTGGETTAASGPGTTAPVDTGTSTAATTGGSEAESGSDDGVASSDGGGSSDATTGSMGTCDPPVSASMCNNPNSIVRGTATVGAGAPASGTLLLALTHQYLGEGASGGIYHASTTIPGVDFTAGPVPFELDMCQGGEMWSEENCEFQLAVTLDANGNGAVDAGEPTGTTFVFVSCMGDNPCLELALECTDGSSCLAFPDPAYCGCPGNGGACNSPIAAC